MRAEYQVLVIPFVMNDAGTPRFMVFRRSDDSNWQFVAGGGENGESPPEAAARELEEEAGVRTTELIQLDTVNSIPASVFAAHASKEKLYVIPEHVFATKLPDESVVLSNEHETAKLVTYGEAMTLLRYDGNKTALEELNLRIMKGDLRKVAVVDLKNKPRHMI